MWRRSRNEIHTDAKLILGAWPGDESAFGSGLIRSLKLYHPCAEQAMHGTGRIVAEYGSE